MGNGFPNRPTRSAFGPTMELARPVKNPKTDLSDTQMNLAFWQAAGAGRVLPQVVIVYDPTIPGITQQGLAFDPRNVLGKVPSVKNGVGDYSFTFASTYTDETGAAVSFVPKAAMAFVQGAAAQDQAVPTLAGQVVQVNVGTNVNAPVDRTILLLVW